jgi:hypothetical protein
MVNGMSSAVSGKIVHSCAEPSTLQLENSTQLI